MGLAGGGCLPPIKDTRRPRRPEYVMPSRHGHILVNEAEMFHSSAPCCECTNFGDFLPKRARRKRSFLTRGLGRGQRPELCTNN